MAEMTEGKCRSRCWKAAAGAGALLFVLLFLTAGFGFFSALLIGLLGYGALGFGCARLVCSESRDGAVSRSAAAASTSGAAAPAGSAIAPTPQPAPAPDRSAKPEEMPEAAPAAETPARETPRVSASAPLAGEADLAARKGAYRYERPAAAAAPARPMITASTVLAGEAELSTRKGSWRYEPGR